MISPGVIWLEKDGLKPYDRSFSDRVHKWNLVEKDGGLVLMAMPHDAGLDFHPELLEAVISEKGWDSDSVRPLGGGVRFRNGEIVHNSTHFGPMPEEYREEVLGLLGISENKKF